MDQIITMKELQERAWNQTQLNTNQEEKMTYQEIDPQMWKPEKEGDFVEGVLVKAKKDVGENNSMLYSLETSEGVQNVWGSAILDDRMTLVREGEKVRITYKGLGESKAGKNPPKIFKVEVDRE